MISSYNPKGKIVIMMVILCALTNEYSFLSFSVKMTQL